MQQSRLLWRVGFRRTTRSTAKQLCVICGSWSSTNLSLALETDGVLFAGTVFTFWTLECGVFVLREAASEGKVEFAAKVLQL
jgi:hypothetical protein